MDAGEVGNITAIHLGFAIPDLLEAHPSSKKARLAQARVDDQELFQSCINTYSCGKLVKTANRTYLCSWPCSMNR